MEKHTYKEIQIDERFQQLAYPMDRQSFTLLEADILSGRYSEPLVIWNGVLIDGFSQYKIYSEHQLPFCAENMEFASWEITAAWICAQQLKRTDIPKELRRFLIGTQYLLEKEDAKRRCSSRLNVKQYGSVRHQIAVRLGAENHVARATVQKYAAYAQMVEMVRAQVPQAAQDILAGRCKISHEKLAALSKLDARSFQRTLSQMTASQQLFLTKKTAPQKIKKTCNAAGDAVLASSVKDMPAFDPDAEVTGLTLTIPSWSGSIDRTICGTNLSLVSAEAKARLASALLNLQKKAAEMLMAIGVE